MVSILPEDLRSPEMTGDWEARLARISQGKESPDAFMSGIQDLTKSVIAEAVSQGDTGIKKANSVGDCPICGNMVREYPNAYYCINQGCTFRKIYKAVKGFHPTIHSITMRELLAYGVEVVNKVPNGGGFWVAGDKNDDMVLDFVKDCKAVNCPFDFVKDSKALKHGSGWCHRVDAMDLPAFEEVFGKIKIASTTPPPTDVMGLIKNSGFEYIDKRANGGSLWIVAGKSEGQELINECKKLGVSFEFTEKGGRASKH